MAAKLYKSPVWLRRKFLHERLTKEEIAKICGVEPMTIYRALTDLGLIKNTRNRRNNL